jgi:hypothetical protein
MKGCACDGQCIYNIVVFMPLENEYLICQVENGIWVYNYIVKVQRELFAVRKYSDKDKILSQVGSEVI